MSRLAARAALAATALALTVGRLAAQVVYGFCMDQEGVPPWDALDYAGISKQKTEEECVNNSTGGWWCPLRNDTELYNYTDPVTGQAVSVPYYLFSPCCSRDAIGNLLPGADGWPTCQEYYIWEDCAYHNWAQKLTNDLLANGYDLSITPGTPDAYYNKSSYKCICTPSDPRCLRVSDDGRTCLICQTDEPCGPDTIFIGVHFFKVHNINLRTSELSLSVWLRQEWYDRRLKYYPQCYGDINMIGVQAKSGSLQESRIWTPDIELYNSEKPIWGGFSERLANIYACIRVDGADCGYVFWSTPGIMKALCKYKGLAAFPYDTLSCELELASWATDGRVQDVRLTDIDNGIQWVDDPNKKDTKGGITAGSSYQDYRIKNISSRRVVTVYDDEGRRDQPWPTLLYKIEFARSGGWYESKLVLPMIALTFLSFITFWISPEMGERLVFGITAILAMLTHDIVASGMMPICEERTYLNYLSIVCQCFAEFALFETAVVLWVYHQEVDSWQKALIPGPIRKMFCMKRLPLLTRQSIIEGDAMRMKEKRRRTYQESKTAAVRDQLFRMMFIEMDKNYNGFLEPDELIFFGSFIQGSRFRHIKDLGFWRNVENGGDDLHVNFEDFVTFCETKIENIDDVDFMKMTCENFLKVSARRTYLIQESWQETANAIDSFCRFSVPFAFFVFICVLNGKDTGDLTDIEDTLSSQWILMFTPVWPMMVIGFVCCALRINQYQKMSSMKKRVGGEGADVGSGWFRSYSVEQDAVHRDAPAPDAEVLNGGSAGAGSTQDHPAKRSKVGKPKAGDGYSGSGF